MISIRRGLFVRAGAAAAGALFLTTACAPPAEPERTGVAESAIWNGLVDGEWPNGANFPGVGQVTLPGNFVCSGVLITPSWVLTAGHCFLDPDIPLNAQITVDFRADVSSPASNPPTHTSVSGAFFLRTIEDPPYQDLNDDDDIAHDMALFRLDTPVPRSVAKPLHPPILAGDTPCPESFDAYMVGYGGDMEDPDCTTPHPSKRTYGFVQGFGRAVMGGGSIVSSDFIVLPGENPCDVYGGSTGGDSGGAIVMSANGDQKLCATISGHRVNGLCIPGFCMQTNGPAVDSDEGEDPNEQGPVSWMLSQTADTLVGFRKVVDVRGDFDGECSNYDTACNLNPSSPGCLAKEADPDGDQVVAACDNCPTVFNPAQVTTGDDLDGDGKGANCDLCAGTVFYTDGPAGDCNYEISVAVEWPNLPAPPVIGAPGSPIAIAQYLGSLKPDACDPVACPKQALANGAPNQWVYPLDQSLLPPIVNCSGLNFCNCDNAIFDCKWVVSQNKIQLMPRTNPTVGENANTPVSVGMRWCKCLSGQDTTSIGGRTQCRASCPMTAAAYGAGGNWVPIEMATSYSTPTTSPDPVPSTLKAFGTNSIQTERWWNFRPLAPMFGSQEFEDGLVIGESVHGMLMSKIVAVDLQPVSAVSRPDFYERAQTFQAGDAWLYLGMESQSLELIHPEFWLEQLCGNCPWDFTMIGQDVGNPAVLTVATPQGAKALQQSNAPLEELFESLTAGKLKLVQASEPLALLSAAPQVGGPLLRGGVLDPTRDYLALASVLQSEQADMTPVVEPQAPADACHKQLMGNEGLAFSATLRQLIVFGGTHDGSDRGVPSDSAYVVDVGGNCFPVGLPAGSRPGSVRAAAFRFVDYNTYLADVDADGAHMLLRRFVPGGSMTVLADLPPLWTEFDKTWFAITEGGDVVFAASKDAADDGLVTVCHNGTESLRLPPGQADPHIGHGDAIGDCPGAIGNDLGPTRGLVARFAIDSTGGLSFLGAKKLVTELLTRPIVSRTHLSFVVPGAPWRQRVIGLEELILPDASETPTIH
jgi:trypsin